MFRRWVVNIVDMYGKTDTLIVQAANRDDAARHALNMKMSESPTNFYKIMEVL